MSCSDCMKFSVSEWLFTKQSQCYLVAEFQSQKLIHSSFPLCHSFFQVKWFQLMDFFQNTLLRLFILNLDPWFSRTTKGVRNIPPFIIRLSLFSLSAILTLPIISDGNTSDHSEESQFEEFCFQRSLNIFNCFRSWEHNRILEIDRHSSV
jgi:hypothetical protein